MRNTARSLVALALTAAAGPLLAAGTQGGAPAQTAAAAGTSAVQVDVERQQNATVQTKVEKQTAPEAGTGQGSASFSQTLSVAGIDTVALSTGVGEVEVTTGTPDSIAVTVSAEPGEDAHFIFDWTAGPAADKVPGDLHLVAQRQGGTLTIGLASGRQGDNVTVTSPSGKHGIVIGDHGWKAHWKIVLPARLALRIDADVGSVNVAGVAGGLTAHLGVGNLDATLPRGPFSAKLGVGKVKADVASSDYGDVSLDAGVGDVSFSVGGRDVKAGYERHVTASSQDTKGPGTTAYEIKVGTGHVDLNLGVRKAADGDAGGDGG